MDGRKSMMTFHVLAGSSARMPKRTDRHRYEMKLRIDRAIDLRPTFYVDLCTRSHAVATARTTLRSYPAGVHNRFMLSLRCVGVRSVLVGGCIMLACGPQIGLDSDETQNTMGLDEDEDDAVDTQMGTGGREPDDPPSQTACFEQRVVYEGDVQIRSFWLTDARGDGLPEIWLEEAEGSSSFGLVRVDEHYEPYASMERRNGWMTAWWADVDGSGRDDIFWIHLLSVTLSDVTGVPAMEIPLVLPELENNSAFILGMFDVTEDGRADFFTVEEGVLKLARGEGDGVFSTLASMPLAPWTRAVLLPSRVDPRSFAANLVDCSECPRSVASMSLAPGDNLVHHATSEVLHESALLDIRRIDDDERADVIVRHRVGHEDVVDVLLADADGQLVPAWRSPTLDAAVAGDFDGDGRVDVVFSHDRLGYAAFAVPSGLDPVRVEVDLIDQEATTVISDQKVADLDGDGRDEIVQLRRYDAGFAIEVIEAVDCGS
jgi:hypothetical protein